MLYLFRKSNEPSTLSILFEAKLPELHKALAYLTKIRMSALQTNSSRFAAGKLQIS